MRPDKREGWPVCPTSHLNLHGENAVAAAAVGVEGVLRGGPCRFACSQQDSRVTLPVILDSATQQAEVVTCVRGHSKSLLCSSPSKLDMIKLGFAGWHSMSWVELEG